MPKTNQRAAPAIDEQPVRDVPGATAYYRSKIGVLRISGGPDGIAAIDFLDAEPAHSNAPAIDSVREAVEQLDEYFHRQRRTFTFKLDLHGTPFQRRVWHELLTIPFGRTRTYIDIALVIGTRKQLRAVGQANGRNPLPIIVPCHRVIGSNGKLTGYGGGLWRKAWLLDFESNAQQLRLL
ncbi:MAG: methylated-DNA--[protein]-cysteine S-methyltransferase [Chloroflexi bacterium]|nr:methylated-DNA--[protein]-cysteine S-methyltransferase [Chloroflexota bacterium]